VLSSQVDELAGIAIGGTIALNALTARYNVFEPPELVQTDLELCEELLRFALSFDLQLAKLRFGL
jgi:hypothetical protein